MRSNEVQFTFKLFEAICAKLKLELLETSQYYLQANVQVQWCTIKVISRLGQNETGHHSNWDTYVTPLKYAYETYMHNSMKQAAFNLEMSTTHHGPSTMTAGRLPQDVENIYYPMCYWTRFIHRAMSVL